MSSDNSRRAPDAPWKPSGVGLAPMFRCGACDKARESAGRRLKRVRGLKTWVCKGCAK